MSRILPEHSINLMGKRSNGNKTYEPLPWSVVVRRYGKIKQGNTVYCKLNCRIFMAKLASPLGLLDFFRFWLWHHFSPRVFALPFLFRYIIPSLCVYCDVSPIKNKLGAYFKQSGEILLTTLWHFWWNGKVCPQFGLHIMFKKGHSDYFWQVLQMW